MVVLKELILSVSTMGKCGGLLLWEGVVVLKELIFNSFYFGVGVEVLKELIFNNFYLGRMW